MNEVNLSVVLGLVRGYGRGRVSERRRRSHFFLFPFFFFLLFLDFLRPPGMIGLIAGGLVGDGRGRGGFRVREVDGLERVRGGLQRRGLARRSFLPVRGPEAVAVAHGALQSGVGRRRPRALFAIRATHSRSRLATCYVCGRGS